MSNTIHNNTPNILFIMSDDHAAHAISCCGSVINRTPHIDRIGNEGVRFNNCFCTNSICTPSRATILTGLYSHKNEVRTLRDTLDGSQWTFPKVLQAMGYQTAVVGKWHLGHGGAADPTGFDYWNVLPGQGLYHNPEMIEMGEKQVREGYVTDIITDDCLKWLEARDPARPFCLLCHHKAPHRPWEPDARHADMFADTDIPEPPTLQDDYADRAEAARIATMRVGRDFTETDLKCAIPTELSEEEFRRWAYQRYIKDYLRVVASIDDNVGRLLDYLDAEKLAKDTIVVYTSDQGFFLGDHGWYDKRFMYEESLRMPLLVRYPREIRPGTTEDRLVINTDFAPTFVQYAQAETPLDRQGRSLVPLLQGDAPDDWRQALYYHYSMREAQHNVAPHYGIRTERYKLVYYYDAEAAPTEWELFDLEKDPLEICSVYGRAQYAQVTADLKEQLRELRDRLDDHEAPWPEE